jgi:DNA-binding PadR family transcriptional regulator
MEVLFIRCRGKRTVLIPPDEILREIAASGRSKFEITRKQLETRLKNLVLDGYIDYSLSDDKGGQKIYVVTLTTRGEAFQREHDERIRRRLQSVGWKVFLAVISSLVTFVVLRLIG